MAKSFIPSVFDYADYRAYLKDWHQAAKKGRAGYSFRAFSKKAGFTSPNFLKLVMEGKRNLTEESLAKFTVGLMLNRQEQEFFRSLVFYTQAKSHEQRDFYYQQILRSRKFTQLKPIEKDQYEYCSEWYHAVVRELVAAEGFDGTPEWIAKRICPAITAAQAKKSLDTLERLGFLKRLEGDLYSQASSLVSTGAEVASVALLNYHMKMLDLTKEVLDRVPADKRDVSALTLGVSEGRLNDLKKKIRAFREDILKMASTDTAPEMVVQVNIQLFPLAEVKQKS